MSLRPDWSTVRVPGSPRLHRETLCQNERAKERKRERDRADRKRHREGGKKGERGKEGARGTKTSNSI